MVAVRPRMANRSRTTKPEIRVSRCRNTPMTGVFRGRRPRRMDVAVATVTASTPANTKEMNVSHASPAPAPVTLTPTGGRYPYQLARYDPQNIRGRMLCRGDVIVV